MICNKCKEDKPQSEFQTYWHSTQQKFRTRRQCNTCFYTAKNEYKKRKKYEKEPVYCYKCKEWIKPEAFYGIDQKTGRVKVLKGNPKYIACYDCRNEATRKYYYQNKSTIVGRKKGVIPKYERAMDKPNTYTSDEQKEDTFNILKAMGWEFNEENGIWWKDGFKSKEGIFKFS